MHGLACDEAQQLIHAILYRNGVATFAATPQTEEHVPLEDRLKDIFDRIDREEEWLS